MRLAQPAHQVVADGPRTIVQPFLDNQSQGREGGGAGQRMPAEGGDMTQRRVVGEHADYVVPTAERAERKAAAERLGQYYQVGDDAEVLQGEEASGATQPRQHFVEDEERSGGVAARAERVHKVSRGNPDAAFRLHRLDHDRRGVRIDEVEGAGVAIRQMFYRTRQRTEGSAKIDRKS